MDRRVECFVNYASGLETPISNLFCYIYFLFHIGSTYNSRHSIYCHCYLEEIIFTLRCVIKCTLTLRFME